MAVQFTLIDTVVKWHQINGSSVEISQEMKTQNHNGYHDKIVRYETRLRLQELG